MKALNILGISLILFILAPQDASAYKFPRDFLEFHDHKYDHHHHHGHGYDYRHLEPWYLPFYPHYSPPVYVPHCWTENRWQRICDYRGWCWDDYVPIEICR